MRRRLASVAFALLLPIVLAARPTVAGADDRPALKVTIDRAKVDLPRRQLEVKLSRAAAKVRLKVFGDSGAVLSETEKTFAGVPAGTALELGWPPTPESDPVAKVEVWGYDTDGYYAGVAIVPWNVRVPHQEVNFATGSDAIQAADVPKLEASAKTIGEIAAKHAGLGKVTLFVLGHTDTVGSQEQNLALSRRRARSIASWFKGHGVAIAVAFEGVGESSPLVKTADEVDEPRNRRVDYILALEPPPLPAAEYSWKTP